MVQITELPIAILLTRFYLKGENKQYLMKISDKGLFLETDRSNEEEIKMRKEPFGRHGSSKYCRRYSSDLGQELLPNTVNLNHCEEKTSMADMQLPFLKMCSFQRSSYSKFCRFSLTVSN